MKLEIEVTENDCVEGCRGTERYCVVSTAIARLLPAANRIETNINTIRFTMKDDDGKVRRYAYRTPDAVRDYIRAFDAGEEAKPMKFVLDHPQVANKTPAPKGRAKAPSFRPQSTPQTRRSVRVFGEKAFASRKP